MGRIGSEAEEIAGFRSTTPKGLSKQLRGELDWVVGKALEKDRARRYSSASELAADVERYLANEVVLASPPSAAYQLKKAYQRNRALFLSAGVVFAITFASAVALAIMLREQAQARASAERANQFLTSVVGSTTSGDVLDEIARRIDEEFAGDEAAQIDLRLLLGRAYRNLDRFEEARLHFGACLDLQRVSGDSLALAETVADLASVFAAEGSYERAQAYYERALSIQSGELGSFHASTMTTRIPPRQRRRRLGAARASGRALRDRCAGRGRGDR